MSMTSTDPIGPAEIAGAMLTAARRIGLEGTLLRMAAAELPDDAWRSEWTLTEGEGGAVSAAAVHRCLLGCTGEAGRCLTALKVEQFVSRELGHPYGATATCLDGERLKINLQPF